MSYRIIGTAGHIDHGKSALVRALSGTDPDRLPEEIKRKITIDLGYAFLNESIAIIDVPGHERFIRNMVAGASTIDYALLVIAADDGIMPQTGEHLQILNLLGVKEGAVVITKIQLAPLDWLDLVESQVHDFLKNTFLENAPVFRVDSLSNTGIPELKAYLLSTLSKQVQVKSDGVFRLPVDRVFSVKGRGTVVTGTILSGTVRVEDRLEGLPGQHDVRVKHLETHGLTADSLSAGQRAALNLMGDTEAIARGTTLTTSNSLCVTNRLRVKIDLIRNKSPLKEHQRVRFLIGTQEVIGRIQLVSAENDQSLYANVILESATVSAWGDHFILRRYSPLETLGGGIVLEAETPRLAAGQMKEEIEFSRALDTRDLVAAVNAFVLMRGSGGMQMERLASSFGVTISSIETMIGTSSVLLQMGHYVFARSRVKELYDDVKKNLSELHRSFPDRPGFTTHEFSSKELTRLDPELIQGLLVQMESQSLLVREGNLFRIGGSQVVISPEQDRIYRSILTLLAADGFAPRSSEVLSQDLKQSRNFIEKTLVQMEKIGLCRRLGLDLFFEAKCFDSAIQKIRDELEKGNPLSVSDVSRILSSSRKYVVPFLEYLDKKGITERQENVRVRGRNFTMGTGQ